MKGDGGEGTLRRVTFNVTLQFLARRIVVVGTNALPIRDLPTIGAEIIRGSLRSPMHKTVSANTYDSVAGENVDITRAAHITVVYIL